MVNFQIGIERPEEIIPRLGKQDLHWKIGRSAYELAKAWMTAGDVPTAVRQVLDTHDAWRGGILLDGIFERETVIPGKGRPSQTDLLAIIQLATGNAIIGVEGKVDESFGPRVEEWLAEKSIRPAATNSNKTDRLHGLCETLRLDLSAARGLYYQLLHRTCAAVDEARRFGYGRALMLVHSFSASSAWFEELRLFSEAMGIPMLSPNTLSAQKQCGGLELQLGWVSDTVSARPGPDPRWEIPEVEGVYVDFERGLWCSNANPMIEEENPPQDQWRWHQAKPARGNLNREDWEAWELYLDSPLAAEGLVMLSRLTAQRALRRLRSSFG